MSIPIYCKKPKEIKALTYEQVIDLHLEEVNRTRNFSTFWISERKVLYVNDMTYMVPVNGTNDTESMGAKDMLLIDEHNNFSIMKKDRFEELYDRIA